MALPFYSTTVDSVGRERTYWTVEGLRCSPNGAEVWKTDASGAITGTLAFATSATVQLANGTSVAPSLTDSTGTSGFYRKAAGAWAYTTGNNPTVQFDSGGIKANSVIFDVANQDVVLIRDAANTLAQRNGTNAQAFNLYNTYILDQLRTRRFRLGT